MSASEGMMRSHTRLLIWLLAVALALALLLRQIRFVIIVQVGWLQAAVAFAVMAGIIYVLLALILDRLGR
jgi:hypothetical protein